MFGRTESRSDQQNVNSESPAEVLRIKDLTKVYRSRDDSVRAVDGISFAVNEGQVVGLLGPNGAGKTTIIKSILGLIIPTAGSVFINGADASKSHRKSYNHVAAMLEGARNIYWRLTVQENLDFFSALGTQDGETARRQQNRILNRFGLSERADSVVNTLSRGQKQKVSLACTLSRNTDIVFLDEPTLGLDVEASLELRRELRRFADEENRTILISSHDMDVIEQVCDRVIILSNGEIVVNDYVDELIQFFQTESYELVLGETCDSKTREQLKTSFETRNWTTRGPYEAFEVTLGEEESLYEVFDVLREFGIHIERVEDQTPNLEEIFLEVTERDVLEGEYEH